MTARPDADEPGDGVTLLGDLRDLFEASSKDHLPTSQILAGLNGLEERPWRMFRDGQPLQSHHLARLLKPFDIRPKQARVDGSSLKAYERKRVMEAADRYCGPKGEAPKQLDGDNGFHDESPETMHAPVSDSAGNKSLN